MATSGRLKIEIFWKKGYDVIISVHDVEKNFYRGIQIIT